MGYVMTDPIKDNDHSSMAREIYNFVDNLEYALQRKTTIDVDIERIMICGMGGSAIGGDVIRDCVVREAKYPISVQRFPELPKWVDKKTFIVISSYSGNTRETLSMYRQAMERGCPILIMASGGELERLGIENGQEIIKMAGGLQPRSTLGLNIGYLAGVMDALCGTRCREDMIDLLPSLRKVREKLNLEMNDAKKIAIAIHGRVPIIYSTSGIYASAMRWKSQINENSKMMTFSGSVPEFNHNEIAGWSEGELRVKCVPVFLYESSAPKMLKKMADASISSMKKYGQDVKVVRIRGKTPVERTLRSIMIGDYVSLYLAELKGVDPMDVQPINEFKYRLSLIMPGRIVGKKKKNKSS